MKRALFVKSWKLMDIVISQAIAKCIKGSFDHETVLYKVASLIPKLVLILIEMLSARELIIDIKILLEFTP